MQRALRILGHQKFVNPGKTRLILAAAPPGSISFPFSTRYAGISYRGDAGHYIDWWLYFFGTYEPDISRLLCDQARQLRQERGSVTFVDVGANIGAHSLVMSNLCDRVIAFEPNPEYADRLQGNAERNGLDNIEVRRLGLASEPGKLHYIRDSATGTGWFTNTPEEHPEAVELPVMTGKEALADVHRIDLLKIDVDGFEAEVLCGLRPALLRDRPVIVIEWTPEQQKRVKAAGDLEDLLYPGRRLQRIELARWSWGYRLRDLQPGAAFPEYGNYLVTPS